MASVVELLKCFYLHYLSVSIYITDNLRLHKRVSSAVVTGLHNPVPLTALCPPSLPLPSCVLHSCPSPLPQMTRMPHRFIEVSGVVWDLKPCVNADVSEG